MFNTVTSYTPWLQICMFTFVMFYPKTHLKWSLQQYVSIWSDVIMYACGMCGLQLNLDQAAYTVSKSL